MHYDDMRAELTITLADGYRLPSAFFNIPLDHATRQAISLKEQAFTVERIRYDTRIAQLERQVTDLTTPKPFKWWQRHKKNKN